MTIWPPDKNDLKRPAYQSLAEWVASAIRDNTLKPGLRLPTHRELAYQIGLSIHTVSRAYEELVRRGLIVAHVGRGTFVRGEDNESKTPFVTDSAQESLIDCSILKPVCADVHLQTMQSALLGLGTELRRSVVTSFRPANALQPYTPSFEKWLQTCGLETSVGSVLVTNGNTAAMTIALMTVARSGDVIVTEKLGHHTLKALAAYLGLRLKGLDTDREGILPDDFHRACQDGTVRALYVMPSGLNPTAAMMGTERRQDIAAIARRFDVKIIENDAWGPLQTNRPEPIAHIAPERTFYFTGFSKCLMPGLRIGCLVVPTSAISASANRHLATNWIATPLMAEIAANWIVDGTADALLEWQKQALNERNMIAAKELASSSYASSPNGLHVWLSLPETWTEQEFVAQAHLNGVAVAPGSVFAVAPDTQSRGVRICLGSPSTEDLERALRILAQLAQSVPEPVALAL
ncbi:transcriptional regulator, GntR family [Roseibium hamelinense]|uniref:Transcriptional regulator, GntR family n=1 Tax=Roseibium hamelinense TaxID=150831 RepID=A0A562SNT4_9HYPH|nr:PLP-dependent aminotransferase family protein [Roseibium hamelinense]TWI82360.1 transcriptional regulator, GntR family [Roseibium hamelinense]